MEGVAALVFITTILIPAVELSLMLYVLLPVKLGQVPQGLAPILRVLQSVRPVEHDAGVHSRRARRAGETRCTWRILCRESPSGRSGVSFSCLTGAVASFNTHDIVDHGDGGRMNEF